MPSEDSFPLEDGNVAADKDYEAEEESQVLAAGANAAVLLEQASHLTVALVQILPCPFDVRPYLFQSFGLRVDFSLDVLRVEGDLIEALDGHVEQGIDLFVVSLHLFKSLPLEIV